MDPQEQFGGKLSLVGAVDLADTKTVEKDLLDQIADALGNTLIHLFATDQANAAANASLEVRPRPLTVKVQEALSRLSAVIDPPQAELVTP